ncbi:7651_t:CDS:2, partial [Dentiscutata erythropus]
EINVFAASSNCNTNTTSDPCVQANSLLRPCGSSILKPQPTSTSVELRISTCMSTSDLNVHVRNETQYISDCASFGAQFNENAPTDTGGSGGGSNFVLIIIFVIIAIIAVAVVASLVICQLCRRKRQQNQNAAAAFNEIILPDSHNHYTGQNQYSIPQSNMGYSSAPPPRYY